MSVPENVHELIQKYLDALATDAELVGRRRLVFLDQLRQRFKGLNPGRMVGFDPGRHLSAAVIAAPERQVKNQREHERPGQAGCLGPFQSQGPLRSSGNSHG